MDSLVTVRSFASRVDADVARGVLQSEGIESFIFSDDAGGAYPMPFALSVALKVYAGDGEKAKQLLTVRKSEK